MTPEEQHAAWFLLGNSVTPEQVRMTGNANPDLTEWCERTASNMDELTVTL